MQTARMICCSECQEWFYAFEGYCSSLEATWLYKDLERHRQYFREDEGTVHGKRGTAYRRHRQSSRGDR